MCMTRRVQMPAIVETLGASTYVTGRCRQESASRDGNKVMRRARAADQVGSCRLNLKSNDVSWSAERYRLFDVTPGTQASCELLRSKVNPEDRNLVAARWQEARVGAPSDLKHRIARNGGMAWVRERSEQVFDDGGRVVYAYGTVQDITERTLAELALQESESWLRRTQQAAHIGVYTHDFANDRWIGSDELHGIFGIGTDFPRTAEGWLALVHPDDRAMMAEHLHEVAGGRRRRFDREYRMRRADNGEERWLHGLGLVECDPTGKPLRMVGAIRDITLYKQLELEATRARQSALAEQLKAITAMVPGAIYALRKHPDGHFFIPYLDGRKASILGLDPQILAADATPLFDRIHPDDRSRLLEGLEQSAAAMTPWFGVLRVVWPGPGERWIEGNSLPRREADGSIVWHGYLADVTERVAATRALERAHHQSVVLTARLELVREEERTRIARELHDELGQTLTAIRMNLRRVKTTARNVGLLAELACIESMVEETTQTVRRIARELRPRILDTLDLGGAIKLKVDEFSKRNGLRCRCRVPSSETDLPEQVKAHIYRIFQEAMTNIARHAHPSRVEVELMVSDDLLRLTVTDNGKGFPSGALASNTLGITGMSERANQIGATLMLTTVPQIAGTCVELQLPLPVGKMLPLGGDAVP